VQIKIKEFEIAKIKAKEVVDLGFGIPM